MFVKKVRRSIRKKERKSLMGNEKKELAWIKERVELRLYKVSPEEKTTRPINYETQIILF